MTTRAHGRLGRHDAATTIGHRAAATTTGRRAAAMTIGHRAAAMKSGRADVDALLRREYRRGWEVPA
jgi:hypothetical protein